ncbi:MAG: CPBP family glutamic-type intramembrane protease [Candidatus Neomarinimicrobiota bacterium]|nr:CPBP family glutamic-type intramembrane protease [Candidatus Neomarinimicrobiota bacterium]
MNDRLTYWELSRSPYYSFILVLPFFAIYEVMVLFLSRDEMVTLRNGADVLMRQFLSMFGEWGLYVLSISFIVMFLAVFLIQKKEWNITVVKSDYLLGMLVEGTAWGFVLYLAMRYVPVLLMFPSGKDLVRQVILAIGAGLYEEFVFRVVAIMAISQVLRLVFLWEKKWRLTVSVILCAALFSAFHFIGPYGEIFNLSIFLYRLFAGVFLGTLYVVRGFGITAHSHMVYDFVVIFGLTVSGG